MLIFLMGFFYALNYHFAVFSKMMHIKDTVEVATCCANYGCLSRLHFCSMSEICGCFGELGKRRAQFENLGELVKIPIFVG